MRRARVGGFEVGEGCPLLFIGGPCVIESEPMLLDHAAAVRDICAKAGVPLVFKSSYDKANRMSGGSFRGPGLKEGLRALERVRRDLGIATLTDVHSPEEAEAAGPMVDALQVPAFMCRQTDLVVAAARHGKAVNLKKGQFMAPEDMRHEVEKARAAGQANVLLTERGTTFGYHDLIVDMRSIPIMQQSGAPVIFDAGHSVQTPGAAGGTSGGRRDMIPVLARAAVAAGCDGIFLEVHRDPDRAPSDGPNMLPLDQLEALLRVLLRIREAGAS